MAIILCTLLAGGGVFWAAAEPIAHFTSPPPVFGAECRRRATPMPPTTRWRRASCTGASWPGRCSAA
ncbi:BCCT family transporter [Cobetia sp. ICG0124]|uniref:BCCT family transporter n=1 Tax=Cobetia sp. ICG0124 TaxID=2053669 RepID=UPI0023EA5519|nr:BCCT family transporter [Cobetia sp. ICG0124]